LAQSLFGETAKDAVDRARVVPSVCEALLQVADVVAAGSPHDAERSGEDVPLGLFDLAGLGQTVVLLQGDDGSLGKSTRLT
jgi:hypothetical protein